MGLEPGPLGLGGRSLGLETSGVIPRTIGGRDPPRIRIGW